MSAFHLPVSRPLRTLSESPTGQEDEWSEGSEHDIRGSSWNKTFYSPSLGTTRSAPLLPAAHSSHTSTWYSTAPDRGLGSHTHSLWKPLGGTWRDWEKDFSGNPLRQNVDDGNAFLHGTLPRWNKGINMRKIHMLEHELTWTYYRTRRHAKHPVRKEVGDPHLPPECVAEKMRFGSENKFQFWRDLRPPFRIRNVQRQINEPEAGRHPDGDLFLIEYHCAIDYVGERLWNEKSCNGTFDNKIGGIAHVRIPDGFPKCRKPMTIVSWGNPSFNSDDALEDDGPVIVDPVKWMPISDELNLRADLPRFAACREATRKAIFKRPVEMQPLQKLLLGPHSSLPRLAMVEAASSHPTPGTPVLGKPQGGTPSPTRKTRKHRIFTAAAGFVDYAG